MNQESKRSSFDELVAGINSDERKYLLSKLNQNKKDMAILQPINDITDVSTLSVRFQNESMLYKFILWIRSMLTKKPQAELYNEALIARIASSRFKNISTLRSCAAFSALPEQKYSTLLPFG